MEMPAQTGKDRFGVMSPATGSNLENPVRLASRLGGQDLKSVALPRSAQQ
jgi:cbb3-type cytochrome oxidase cytochrome c subunit